MNRKVKQSLGILGITVAMILGSQYGRIKTSLLEKWDERRALAVVTIDHSNPDLLDEKYLAFDRNGNGRIDEIQARHISQTYSLYHEIFPFLHEKYFPRYKREDYKTEK